MGVDICVIPQKYIEQNMYYFLGVVCHRSCGFHLKIFYSQNFHFKAGQATFYYSNQKKNIYEAIELRIQVGNNTDMSTIIISSILQNPYNVTQKFHIYFNQGNDVPTPKNYDFISKDLWFQGQGIIVNQRSSPPFRINTNYTILMEIPPLSIVLINTELYGKQR